MKFVQFLRDQSDAVWEACYHHPFLQQLGSGELPLETFQFYLLQDYVYLFSYAKVFALGVQKARSEKRMRLFSGMQSAILETEMELHRGYMRSFFIAQKQVEQVRPSFFNQGYTANMLVAGEKGEAELLAAVLPCAWSYQEFACRLFKDYEKQLVQNPYRSWIELYSGAEYSNSIAWMGEALEEEASLKTEEEKEELSAIFKTSMEMEYLFWEMCYQRQAHLV